MRDMVNIRIGKSGPSFDIADLSEFDGKITGTCEDLVELKAAATDGSVIYVDGVSRGKITYSWFPISGHFQIYI